MSKRTAKPGDFFAVHAEKGFGYIRFVERHPGPLPMDTFAVLENPSWRQLRDEDLPALTVRYFMGSSAKYLPRDPRFKLIAGAHLEALELPRLWRMTRAKGWSVVDNGAEGPARELDDDMARLPIVQIVSGKTIIERLFSDWTPDMERLDSLTRLFDAIRNSRDTRTKKAVTVFLDFDDDETTRQTAGDLARRGFQVEPGEDDPSLSVTAYPDREGANWLSTTEEAILSIAVVRGGRYAGNEVEL
jgi:hypothetical protein